MFKNILIGLSALSLAATPAAADDKKHNKTQVVQVQPHVVYTQPRSTFGIYVGTSPYNYNSYSYNPYNQYRFYNRGYYGPLYPKYDGTYACRERGRYGIATDAYGRLITRYSLYRTPRSRMRCYTY